MKTLRLGVVICLVSGSALAQGFGFSIAAGPRFERFGNGITKTTGAALGSINLVTTGYASKYFAVLLPVNGIVQVDTRGTLDMQAEVDLMFRVGFFALGGGGSLRLSVPGYLKFGGVDFIFLDPVLLGASLAARINLWPQGRLFIQGRYTFLPVALDYRGPSAVCAGTACGASDPVDYVTGREVRVAIGFALPTERNALNVRVQWTWRDLYFEQAGDSDDLIYDRSTHTITAGVFMYF